MPIVATFDGENRRIILDASVYAAGGFNPLDIYPEYLAWRAIEGNRIWEPLMYVEGGDPKGGGAFTERSLVLVTDDNGVTAKLVPPPTTTPRTLSVTGVMRTDVADTDPETIDLTTTTASVFFSYQPSATEVVKVDVPALTDEQIAALLFSKEGLERLMKAYGMVPGATFKMPPATGGTVVEDGQAIATVSGDCDTGFTVTGNDL